MTDRLQRPRFQIADLSEIDAVQCPCGQTRRAFIGDAEPIASVHLVEISAQAKTHYHKKLTEIYYVLAGRGQIELDGQCYDVKPGTAILIKPGCRHRAIGQLTVLNIPIPAFDPADEWFD